MLVLTRRKNEGIVIGGNIRISVEDIGPGRVKIGIVAPDDFRVDRIEIHERIVAALAAGSPASPEPDTMLETVEARHEAVHDAPPRKRSLKEAARSPLPRKPR
jgi:carbon storage regulator